MATERPLTCGLLALVAAAAWLLAPRVLRALARPEADELAASDPDDPAHRGFSHLVDGRLRAWLAVALAAAAAVIALRARLPLAWLGLLATGVLAAVVDARTRYLPLRLMQAAWALGAVGLLAESARAGTPGPLLRGAAGAAALGLLFLVLWRLGAMAFGDVRLAVAIGGAAGGTGWPSLLWALVLGTTAGACWGVASRAITRRREFAYGPGLLLGAMVSLLL